MIKAVLSNILNHSHDRRIRSEYEELIERNAERLKAKQSDEQIVLKAIRVGYQTIAGIERDTGLPSELIIESINELQRLGKVTRDGERFTLPSKD